MVVYGLVRRFAWVSAALLVCLCATLDQAQAGEIPLYEPAPDWIDSTPVEEFLADNDLPPGNLVALDRQFKLEGGETWALTDIVLRITSAESLTELGKLEGSWHPSKGDLIVHRTEILRDGETIDILAGGQTFEVLRRESALDKLQLNGILTAFLQIQGLRVGDLVRFTASVTNDDPALGGRSQLIEGLRAKPFTIGYGRFRAIWPESSDLDWKVSGKDVEHELFVKDGYTNLVVSEPVAKQPDAAQFAPKRFTPIPLVEISGFDSWETVSQAVAGLYSGNRGIANGSDLASEVDAIAARTGDSEERAALALQLVQDKVRYLFNGLGQGNYVPQKPDETWELRYGDCKAKTLLLLAVLERLGIAAEPAMASTVWTDAVAQRLPSFAAFDHIIVRAKIGDRIAWLDGTRGTDRQPDLYDMPLFRYALPATDVGSQLVALPMRPMARPMKDIAIDVDLRAGLAFPGVFSVQLILRGQEMQLLRQAKTMISKDQFDDGVDAVVQNSIANAFVFERSVEFDDDAGTVTILAKGVKSFPWETVDERRKLGLPNNLDGFNLDVNRARPAWEDIPYITNYPGYEREHLRLRLPDGHGAFAVEGIDSVHDSFGGYDISREAALDGYVLSVDEFWRTSAWEVPADAIAQERTRLARVTTTPLKLAASDDYPERWEEIRLAKEGKRLGALRAAYDAIVEQADEDSVDALLNRARFHAGIDEDENAAADLAQILERQPDAATYAWRARLLADTDAEAAIDDAERALELDPTLASATSTLVELHSDRNDADAAIAVLDRAQNNGADKVDIAVMRALALDKAGRNPDAVASLNAIIAERPGNPRLLNSRCWIKARGKLQLDTALKDCTKAIELSERPSDILDSRGLVYFQMGRYKDAIADYDAALKLAPGLASSRYVRGIAHMRLGNSTSGRRDVASAMDIDPKVDSDYSKIGILP